MPQEQLWTEASQAPQPRTCRPCRDGRDRQCLCGWLAGGTSAPFHVSKCFPHSLRTHPTQSQARATAPGCGGRLCGWPSARAQSSRGQEGFSCQLWEWGPLPSPELFAMAFPTPPKGRTWKPGSRHLGRVPTCQGAREGGCALAGGPRGPHLGFVPRPFTRMSSQLHK